MQQWNRSQRPQKIAEVLGHYGCYLFSIAESAGKEVTFSDYEEFLKQGWIGDQCWVSNPGKIAEYYHSGARYEVTKVETALSLEQAREMLRPGGFLIVVMKPNKVPHYVYLDEHGVLHDSLGKYNALDEIIGWRVFNRAA